tara:strand:- start:257 stop:958 length:702 start_codon:yes stop_codon:yes gene_type:complete
MEIICITGDTGSIASALIEKLLKKKRYKIYGCSTSITKIVNKNYNHKIIDTTNQKKIREWFENIFKKEKKINTLLCLSGTTSGGNLVYNFSSNEFNANILSTIKSTFICNKEVLKYLIKSKGGSIINISSIAEKKNLVGSAIYSSAKSAISKFTKILAKENLNFNINANVILPMYIENKETKKRGSAWKNKILSMQDSKKVGEIISFVNLVCFLSDKKNRLITGQEISIGTVI